MSKLTLLEKVKAFITNKKYADSNMFFLEFIGRHINNVRHDYMTTVVSVNRVYLEKCGVDLTFDEKGICNGIDYSQTLISPMDSLRPLALTKAKTLNKKIRIRRFGGMRGITYHLEVCNEENTPIVEYISCSSLRGITETKIWK